MARKFQYGIGITGFCLALAAGQMAAPGLAAAARAHGGAVIRAHLAAGAHQAAGTAGDPTMGRAAARSAPPRHLTPTAAAPGLTICSFDATRSRAPFATATGTVGYAQMRADLLSPAKFGPNGTVHRTIIIANGVPTMTTASLAGCDVFFTSVFTPALSSGEAAALKAAYGQGMRVITDADADTDEMNSANSVMTALGLPAAFVGAGSCGNDANGGVVRLTGGNYAALYGPFGDLRGDTWGTSVSAGMARNYTAAVKCGGAGVRNVTAGKVLAGGDLSGVDLFTSPAGGLFNPANEAAYLNFIGSVN